MEEEEEEEEQQAESEVVDDEGGGGAEAAEVENCGMGCGSGEVVSGSEPPLLLDVLHPGEVGEDLRLRW